MFCFLKYFKDSLPGITEFICDYFRVIKFDVCGVAYGQHCTVSVIGIATYPRATFGFSMIATVVLHREHIIVFPK